MAEGNRRRFTLLSEREWEIVESLRTTGTIPSSGLVQSDLNTRRLNEKHRYLSDRYKTLLGELDKANSRLDILEQFVDADTVSFPPISKDDDKQGERGEATAVMIASDWHVEERVDPETINWMNEYTLNICEQRGSRFFVEGLRLVKILRSGYKIDNLVLALLGDLISGYIHEELVETNQLSPIEASLYAKRLVCAGIDFLLEHGDFKNIRVVCCFGNHGRTTKRKRHATGHKNSYEWLMYSSLADHYNSDPRIKFIVSSGYHSYCHVYDDYVIRFHHGDGIKYYGGVGGLTIPANKAIAKWNTIRHADLDVFGHFHQFFDGGQFVCNGCFLPGSQVTVSDGRRVPIEGIVRDDVVLNLSGSVNQVEAVTVRRHVGRVVCIQHQGRFSQIGATPNHEFWAIKGNQRSQSIMVGSKESKTVFRRTEEFLEPSWVRAEYLSVGDYVHVPYCKTVNDDPCIDLDYCKLLGFYLAEGSLTHYGNGRLGQIDFTFHKDEVEYASFVASQLLQRFGLDTQQGARTDCGTRHVGVGNADVANVIYELCGKGSHDKVLSPSLMMLPKEKQIGLIGGWVCGDGSLNPARSKKGRFRLVSACTVSYDLACQMQQLALRCGFAPRLYAQKAGGRRKSDSYLLHFGKEDARALADLMGKSELIDFDNYRETSIGALRVGEDVFFPIQDIWSESYDGFVHDLQIAGEHSYVVNGVGVHNSLIGWNAYAVAIKASYEQPKQGFILIERGRGKSIVAEIFVGKEHGHVQAAGSNLD